MIKNLSQLKRVLQSGAEFEITGHCKPDCIGRRRQITKANTQGIYSIIPAEPESKTSKANDGKGTWLSWSRAPFWEFENGICALYSSNTHRTEEYLLISFRVLQKEAA